MKQLLFLIVLNSYQFLSLSLTPAPLCAVSDSSSLYDPKQKAY